MLNNSCPTQNWFVFSSCVLFSLYALCVCVLWGFGFSLSFDFFKRKNMKWSGQMSRWGFGEGERIWPKYVSKNLKRFHNIIIGNIFKYIIENDVIFIITSCGHSLSIQSIFLVLGLVTHTFYPDLQSEFQVSQWYTVWCSVKTKQKWFPFHTQKLKQIIAESWLWK